MGSEIAVKHTPGPFAVEKVVSEEAVDIVLDYDVPELGRPVLIGSTYFDDTTRMPGISIEQAIANANMFAAAPDLLAALIKIENEIEARRASTPLGEEIKVGAGMLLSLIVPLIAKATQGGGTC